RRSTLPVPDRLLLLAVAACCALQLFNLALLTLLGLAFVKREGLAAARRPDVLFAAGLIAVSFAAWIALAAGLGLAPGGMQGEGLKDTIRSLLDYPHFFVFWGYPREWPMLSVVAVIGGLYAFDRASRRTAVPPPGEARAAGFLLLALGTPLIVNGLFDTSFELFRYNVPFNSLYFTFVALALLRWREVVAAAAPAGRRLVPGARAAAAGTAALALLVLSFDLNPLRAWLVTQQDYRNEEPLYRAFDLERRPDFKTPAAYLASHAADEDTIIVLDSREYYNYLGELDYWVRTGVYESQTYSRDGTLHDLYIGTPLLMSLAELKGVLEQPGRRKWLAASDSMLASTRAVSDDIKQFIREQDEHVVYVGRDGTSKVYRFDTRQFD
ncbi:MAG: hypothetical protein JXB36_00295, partial [Gammaproteobacteria bacterium]|nr:hypothetical protein [Gammaproteobacteria bacterium]